MARGTEKSQPEPVSGDANDVRKKDYRNWNVFLVHWFNVKVRIKYTQKILKDLYVNDWFMLYYANEWYRVIQPQCLGGLVTYFTASESENISKNDAYLYAAGIVLCSLISITVFHPFILYAFQLGMRIRLTCCSLIYKKVRIDYNGKK